MSMGCPEPAHTYCGSLSAEAEDSHMHMYKSHESHVRVYTAVHSCIYLLAQYAMPGLYMWQKAVFHGEHHHTEQCRTV